MKEQKLVNYNHLIKRALKVSIELVIILIILYFLPDIFNLIRLLYGF